MSLKNLKKTQLFLFANLLLFCFVSFLPSLYLNNKLSPIIVEQEEKTKWKNSFYEFELLYSKLYILEIKISEEKLEKQNVSKWENNAQELLKLNKFVLNTDLESRINSFRDYHHNLVSLGKEDLGVIGDFRIQIHKFENLIKDSPKVLNLLLLLRRSEKDFLLRRNTNYLTKHQEIYEKLLLQKIVANNKTIKSYLTTYKSLFEQSVNLINAQAGLKGIYLEQNNSFTNNLDKIKTAASSENIILKNELEKISSRINFVNLISLFLVFSIIAFIYKYILFQQRENEDLLLDLQEQYKQKITLQDEIISQAKLASLGTLTAGIAHEIKNPLNIIINMAKIVTMKINANFNLFVNNMDDFGVIKKSSTLIEQHSLRADQIVKNMLSLVRSENRDKEMVNIEELIKENFSLSLQSQRAIKDFEVTLMTDFEVTLMTDFVKCNDLLIIRSDWSRCFLNIFENSFHAILKKLESEKYIPIIDIQLKKNKSTIEVTVRDNGAGMNENSLKHIFEPFYTTKPPGQGTGLGMSLVYDVVKSENGIITIDSTEGLFTNIHIIIPTRN